MTIEIKHYNFVDEEIKNMVIQDKEELDQYIMDFQTAYIDWEGVEMLNPTATRIWFLLKELRDLRDASGRKNA